MFCLMYLAELSWKVDFSCSLEGDTAAGELCNLPAVSCCLMPFKPFALAHATQAHMQQQLEVGVLAAQKIFWLFTTG